MRAFHLLHGADVSRFSAFYLLKPSKGIRFWTWASVTNSLTYFIHLLEFKVIQ